MSVMAAMVAAKIFDIIFLSNCMEVNIFSKKGQKYAHVINHSYNTTNAYNGVRWREGGGKRLGV